MEERYNVATPENVSFTYDIAGIGSRFMAALVDVLIYFVMAVALALIFSQVVQRIEEADPTLASTLTAIYFVVSFALYWVYYIVFELVWGGQSPGKRLVKLRVVRLDGTPASAVQIIIRNVGRLVDIFPGFYAVGLTVMFLNDQSRRLGDFAAGTLVVRENAKLSLQQLSALTAPLVSLSSAAAEEAAALPVNRLSRDQKHLVREFITRRESMNDVQRARLAIQIGQSIAQQMDTLLPSHPAQAERLIELTAAAITS
jgi:uncharacterized RDD family membrane protein YckC